MATAIDLIGRSMRRAGILAAGETPEAGETSDALAVLNGILEQWSIDGLTVYARREITFSGDGSVGYTIGPTGDVVGTRPEMIVAAFSRVGADDSPIAPAGDDEYSRIDNKSIVNRPTKYRFWPTMPDARIDLWPTPNSSCEIHLIVNQQLSRVESPAQDITFAPGYDRAIFLTLAIDLCVEFQRDIPAGLPELMSDAVASVKRNNINAVPEAAQFDVALTGAYRTFAAG
ncbi:hypothetical protein [Castellaniella sp. S9]|uniref:hypothetical protein n=1 Tax=Castellaniella sp. S9 TaxID=2993652 RepID=UPI0022B4391F|nr:hypothetical protein [Castellaniella sp. S9]